MQIDEKALKAAYLEAEYQWHCKLNNGEIEEIRQIIESYEAAKAANTEHPEELRAENGTGVQESVAARAETDQLVECREAFEAWRSSNGIYPQNLRKESSGLYSDSFTQLTWSAWQSCWNARLEREDRALSHLGNLLYMLAELHPDDQCPAYVEALAYYNAQCPEKRIEPVEGYGSRIVRTGPLDRLLEREAQQPVDNSELNDGKEHASRMILSTIAYGSDNDEWHDEFWVWYKPNEWLALHRAVGAFLADKVKSQRVPEREAVHHLTKEEKEGMHNALKRSGTIVAAPRIRELSEADKDEFIERLAEQYFILREHDFKKTPPQIAVRLSIRAGLPSLLEHFEIRRRG